MNCSIADEGRHALRSDKICIIKSRATGATALELGWESAQADCDDLQITAEKILAVPVAESRLERRGPRELGVCLLSLRRPEPARHRDHRRLPPFGYRLFANHRHALHLYSPFAPRP